MLNLRVSMAPLHFISLLQQGTKPWPSCSLKQVTATPSLRYLMWSLTGADRQLKMNGLCAQDCASGRLKHLLNIWGNQEDTNELSVRLSSVLGQHYLGYQSDCCASGKLSYVIGPAKQMIHRYVQETMPHGSAEEQLQMEQTLVADRLAATEAEEIKIQYLTQLKLEAATCPKPRTKIARKQQKKNEKKQQKKNVNQNAFRLRNLGALLNP